MQEEYLFEHVDPFGGEVRTYLSKVARLIVNNHKDFTVGSPVMRTTYAIIDGVQHIDSVIFSKVTQDEIDFWDICKAAEPK